MCFLSCVGATQRAVGLGSISAGGLIGLLLVLHDWYVKGRGMCSHVCLKLNIKPPYKR